MYIYRIAAVVHAMPLATDQTHAGGGSGKHKNEVNNLLGLIDRNPNQLTEVVNAYFAQLEKILDQLVSSYYQQA